MPETPDPGEYTVPLEKARELLDVRDDRVHTFRGTGPMIIGADWPLARLLEAMERYGVSESGPAASGMGHTLTLTDDRGPLFIATKRVAGGA